MIFKLVRLFNDICTNMILYNHHLSLNEIGMARSGAVKLSSATVMNELSKSNSFYTANDARQGGPACCNNDCEG